VDFIIIISAIVTTTINQHCSSATLDFFFSTIKISSLHVTTSRLAIYRTVAVQPKALRSF
jgi:hypothetical protein